jgi:hypothetical protein
MFGLIAGSVPIVMVNGVSGDGSNTVNAEEYRPLKTSGTDWVLFFVMMSSPFVKSGLVAVVHSGMTVTNAVQLLLVSGLGLTSFPSASKYLSSNLSSSGLGLLIRSRLHAAVTNCSLTLMLRKKTLLIHGHGVGVDATSLFVHWMKSLMVATYWVHADAVQRFHQSIAVTSKVFSFPHVLAL